MVLGLQTRNEVRLNTVSSHFSLPAGITGSCHIIFDYFFLGQDLVDFCPSGSGSNALFLCGPEELFF